MFDSFYWPLLVNTLLLLCGVIGVVCGLERCGVEVRVQLFVELVLSFHLYPSPRNGTQDISFTQ